MKLILLVFFALLFGVTSILLLRKLDPNNRSHQFARREIATLKLRQATELTGAKRKAILGRTGNHLYVATYNASQVLRISSDLDTVTPVFFAVSRNVKRAFYDFRLPGIFVLNGLRNKIYSFDLTGKMLDSYFVKGSIFTKGVYVGGNRFILRQYIGGRRDQAIVHYNAIDSSVFLNDSLNEANRDGGYLTDGRFSYDKATGLYAYLYNRRSRYFIFDSALHLKAIGKTIDSIDKPTRRSSTVDHTNKLDYAYNKATYLHESILYVYSCLKADNESGAKFKNHYCIDIYDIEYQKYLGSY